MKFFAIWVFLFSMILANPSLAQSASEDDLWAAIKNGTAVAMMRHALAPGTGDPDDFNVNNCNTQRNLNGTGRAQAVEIGQRFRKNAIAQAHVFSSAWCRCMDTAKLLELGPVENLRALDSFFRNFEREGAQTAALKEWLKNPPKDKPIIFVTHQVNITALTDIFPQSGEIIVIQPTSSGRPLVLGRLPTPTK